MKYADLLIDPDWRAVVTDKGAEWVTDRYVLLRTDLFKRRVTPKVPDYGGDPTTLRVTAIRKILTKARATDLGPIRDVSEQVIEFPDPLLVFVGPGALMVAIDASVGNNLIKIADPHLCSTGQVTWWQKRRGQAKPVLVGLQMPKRPGHTVGVHSWRHGIRSETTARAS